MTNGANGGNVFWLAEISPQRHWNRHGEPPSFAMLNQNRVDLGIAKRVMLSEMGYYISMRRGFLYLVAIMDWASRKVLAWRLSNTMEADFCVAALEDAIARYGSPDIFNTDQGSQFTSFAFTNTLKDAGIRISMDGRGRWMDNVFIERLWRSLKYECVFLNAFETGSEARFGIGRWIGYYNAARPHSSFGGQDARRGLCYAGRRGETGSVNTNHFCRNEAKVR